ncbi:hypothetical protein BC941DRAFT_468904 [Chlamydoabsidia padenii]|nr:hypothetical protein BC941DRAFT_468904 [Chlamydoabsidia padenii]
MTLVAPLSVILKVCVFNFGKQHDYHHHHEDMPCMSTTCPHPNRLIDTTSIKSNNSNNSKATSCCQCHHQKPDSTLIYMEEDDDTCSESHTTVNHHRSSPYKNKKRNETSKQVTNQQNPTDPGTKSDLLDDHVLLDDLEKKTTTRTRQPKRKCAIAKGLVYLFFLMIILGGIATFFCWPRTPMVVMDSHAERQGAATTWATTPEKRPWMEATWLMNITLDNRDNFIPTRLTRMEMTIVDSLTQNPFATAVLEDLAVAPKMLVVLSHTVFHVHYSARSDSDTTWQDLYRACGPQLKQGAERPSLNVNMKIVFHFLGIIWTSTVNASPPSGGFVCPS